MTEKQNLSSEAITKPDRKLSEDWAYVMNHALSCGVTDTFIQPGIGAYVQKRVEQGKLPHALASIFESRDHHAAAHEQDHHHHDATIRGNLKHWVIGEAAGDVGAVPITVAIQRFAPGAMNALRKVIEPVVGWHFKKGAARNAKDWASEYGLAEDGPEAKAKAQAIYEYEMQHLPQAAVWNMVSIPINLGTQKLTGNKANWKTMAAGKIFGLAVSNGLLIGGRMLSPVTFQRIDKFNGKTLVKPVDKIFGIAPSALKPPEPTEKSVKSWAERSQTSSTEMAR